MTKDGSNTPSDSEDKVTQTASNGESDPSGGHIETDGFGVIAGLMTIRNDRSLRLTALLISAGIGVGLAWMHWIGLFLAGGLVGLVSQTLARAVTAGALLGVVIIGVQLLAVPSLQLGEMLAFRPPVYVTIAIGIGAPVWGALIRGVL